MTAPVKWLAAAVLLASAAIAVLFLLDVHGIRRGCLSSRPDEVAYETGRQLYQDAEREIAAHQYSGASAILDRALSRLGDSYPVGLARDQSGEAVAAAEAAAASGEFQIAAQLKHDAMSQRLSLFERRVRLYTLCQSYLSRVIH